jgi:hypothetical protein
MKTKKPLELSSSEEMERRTSLANEFYDAILSPDEDPAFVSDEATLRDISLAPDEEVGPQGGRALRPSNVQTGFSKIVLVVAR